MKQVPHKIMYRDVVAITNFEQVWLTLFDWRTSKAGRRAPAWALKTSVRVHFERHRWRDGPLGRDRGPRSRRSSLGRWNTACPADDGGAQQRDDRAPCYSRCRTIGERAIGPLPPHQLPTKANNKTRWCNWTYTLLITQWPRTESITAHA